MPTYNVVTIHFQLETNRTFRYFGFPTKHKHTVGERAQSISIALRTAVFLRLIHSIVSRVGDTAAAADVVACVAAVIVG